MLSSFFLFCLPVVATFIAPPSPFIFSITQSGDYSKQNVMLQFNPKNVTNIYNQIAFPYFESVIGRAYDAKNHTVYYYLESFQVVGYDVMTMQQTAQLQLPFESSPATAFVYDEKLAGFWFTMPNNEAVDLCFLHQTDTSGKLQCTQNYPGMYSYVNDGSAFDPVSRVLITTLNNAVGNNVLVRFNVDGTSRPTELPAEDICQNMHVAKVKGRQEFVCVDFTFNLLMILNPDNGKLTDIMAFPFLENPNETASTVSGTSFYTELYGMWEYTWVEVDLATGRPSVPSLCIARWCCGVLRKNLSSSLSTMH